MTLHRFISANFGIAATNPLAAWIATFFRVQPTNINTREVL